MAYVVTGGGCRGALPDPKGDEARTSTPRPTSEIHGVDRDTACLHAREQESEGASTACAQQKRCPGLP